MDFKTTSTNRSARATNAFSLLELIVWSGISSVVLVTVLAITVSSGRSFAALANYTELDQNSRDALDRFSQDIRQMEYLTSYSTTALAGRYSPSGLVTNAIAFAPTPGAASNSWVRYVFNPSARTLTRVSNTVSQVLLTGCDYLNFSLFQRNQAADQLSPIPTTNIAEVKLVQVEWVCSRTLIAGPPGLTNSEGVQSAKFVIRRQ